MSDTRLRELAEAATPGPWFDDHGKIGADDSGIGEMDEYADAALIVAMRNDILALLDRAEAAEGLEVRVARFIGAVAATLHRQAHQDVRCDDGPETWLAAAEALWVRAALAPGAVIEEGEPRG